jgi:hypothetical protein
MMDNSDIKLVSRACIYYEKQDGTHQINLSSVFMEYRKQRVGEPPAKDPTWIVGVCSDGQEWRLPFSRVVMMRTL